MTLPWQPVCRLSDKARNIPETVNERKPTSLSRKKWVSLLWCSSGEQQGNEKPTALACCALMYFGAWDKNNEFLQTA